MAPEWRAKVVLVAGWALVSCCGLPGFASGQNRSAAQQHADRAARLAGAGDFKTAEAEFLRALEFAPDDPVYLGGLGSVLSMQQKLAEAGPYFDRALRIDPDNVVLRRNLAANQWQLGHLTQAKENLERVLKAAPRDAQATLLLGMVSENLKDYATAARLLGSVEGLVQQRPESIAALARAYYQTGEREKARGVLARLGPHPAGPRGVFLGGQVAAQAADYETAEKLFVSIRSTYPDAPTVGYHIALVQYRAGRIEQSYRTLLDYMTAGYVTSDISNLLGWCYLKQNKLREAVGALEKAIELDPSKQNNYLDLAMILMSNQRLPNALLVASKAAERFSTSHQAHQMKGQIETRLQYYTDAVASYRRAVELNPASPEANLGLASAQWAAGMTEEAERTLENGCKQFPRDASHRIAYAALLLRLGEEGDREAEARAVPLLQAAIALDASDAQPHLHLGELAMKKGENQTALRHLETAARLDAKSSRVRFALSRLYRRLGRTQEASREFEIYQQRKLEEERTSLTPSPAGIPKD